MNMYFKHVRIPEQISLHVHDRAWFLEQCMSSRPLCYCPALATSPALASCPHAWYRHASMHAQAGKTSKVTCTQRMRSAGQAEGGNAERES